MNCEKSKTEIELDFLAKENGKYSGELQRHLMSCRKCRDHGVFLTRVLQSAQFDQIEDIPGPLVKKSIESLSKIPVVKEKKGRRLIYFALGFATMTFTVFLAYRAVRNKPATAEVAPSTLSNPALMMSLNLPPVISGNSPEPLSGSDPLDILFQEEETALECNFKTGEEKGFSADFLKKIKTRIGKKSTETESENKNFLKKIELPGFSESSENDPSLQDKGPAKNKNEPLLSVQAAFGLMKAPPLNGSVSKLGDATSRSNSGTIGGLSGMSNPGSGSMGSSSIGEMGSTGHADLGETSLIPLGENNEMTEPDDALKPYVVIDSDEDLSLSELKKEDEKAGSCEMPPTSRHALWAAGEDE